MSWLYLVLSLMGAWFTYNMYRPLRRGPSATFFGFFAGWLWGELALHVIAFQLLASAALIWAGALQAWPGVLAVLVTLATCTALGRGYSRSTEVSPLIERALRGVLGAGYEQEIAPELRRHLEEGVRWGPILRPFSMRHRDVEVIRDIPFARERGITVELDVYRHRSMPTDCPTLLQIHGGGWVIGDKREQGVPLMTQMASRGWVCVSANYRLSPHATWPEHLIDVKRAVRWIHEHGRDYGANPDFIVVTGGSAGGHLAALVALTANEPEYQPGFEALDTRIKACAPIYGVYDFTDRDGLRHDTGMVELLEEKIMKGSLQEIPDAYRQASPMDRITADAPPFMIVHGELDSLVPVQEARRFAELIKEKSRSPTVYVEIPGAQHAFDLFISLRTQSLVDGLERFFGHTYSRYLETRRALPLTAASASAPEPEKPRPAKPVAKKTASKKRAAKKAPAKTSAKKSAKKSTVKKSAAKKSTAKPAKKAATKATTRKTARGKADASDKAPRAAHG